MVAIGFARAEAAGSDCERTVGAAIDESDTESEDEDRLGRAIETGRKLADTEGVAFNTPTRAASEVRRDEIGTDGAIAAGAY
jgi:hypothetical protein